MQVPLYQVDAFTTRIFGGNPACVVPLEEWLDDDILLQVAAENAVAETAFFVGNEKDGFHLRWFTPEIEMDLCGHATLATGHVLRTILGYKHDTVSFKTLSGPVSVAMKGEWYELDFPARPPSHALLPDVISQSLGKQPKEVLKSRDYLLVFETEEDIRNMKINRQLIDQINLDPGGIIVTAPGANSDFVSRFFTPQASIFEDPVTGSAHCSLIPYWSKRLNKTKLAAFQISSRLGELRCEDRGERVGISGRAKTYLAGIISLEHQ